MWPTIPRQRDNVSVMNTGIHDILNAPNMSTAEANRLLVQDERQYFGATTKRGALMTVKLDFGELGPGIYPTTLRESYTSTTRSLN